MIWSTSLTRALKSNLKAQGWTISSIADRLGIGESTAKRWLSGKGVTLDNLEQLCGLAELSLWDLVQRAQAPQAELAQELTLAQEQALSRDPVLAFLFILLLGGTPLNEVEQDFNLPTSQIQAALDQLERLALIDRLRDGRIRPCVDRSIIWRKSPMRAMFEERMKAQFLAMDFADRNAVYASEVVKLSAAGAAQLSELIERHRREIHDLATRDRVEMKLSRKWYAVLFAMRSLDTSGLNGPE